MFALRTTIARRAATLTRRTYATESHGAHHASEGHESFGKGFYLSIAAIVGTLAFVKATKTTEDPNKPPLLTRLINKYAPDQQKLAEIAALRTAMIERARRDRLILMETPSDGIVQHRSLESVFNGGAPWNQEAGRTWGSSLYTVREYLEAQREQFVRSWEQKQKH